MNAPESAFEALRDRRMVLVLPCGDGDTMLALRENGVPSVGLDADPAAVERCRSRGLVAYVGGWDCLAARGPTFDGVLLDRSAIAGDREPLMTQLSQNLLHGGRVVDARSGETLAVCRNANDEAAADEGAAAPLVVGGYADLFVGCRSVLELGAGVGRFLDALHVRDVTSHGVEQDTALAALAVARGHDVHHGGLGWLATREAQYDGIFAGNVVEALSQDEFVLLLEAARAALTDGGRLVIRARRDAPVFAWIGEHGAAHGFARTLRGSVPGDAVDTFTVSIASAGTGRSPDASQLAAMDAVELETASLPIHAPVSSPFDLERFERRVHSQGGEDGILAAIFDRIGTAGRRYVEFGCGDGVQCNTAALRRQGWRGLLMDGEVNPGAEDAVIHQAWITAENIESLLDAHAVPHEIDLMSIDVDGNDYWVWRAIRRRPRVVVVEYNANLGPSLARTIPYDPAHRWDGSDFYGASLAALEKLGREKGYTLVCCNTAGVNAFFVRDDLVGAPRRSVAAVYRPPNYWYRGARQFPDLSRAFVDV